ncbi:MAG: hypothetical protein Q9162_007844 [Coniocarpon cinnabarinum]
MLSPASLDQLDDVAPWHDDVAVPWIPPPPVMYGNKRNLHAFAHAECDSETPAWQIDHTLDISERNLEYARGVAVDVRQPWGRPDSILDVKPFNYVSACVTAEKDLLSDASSWNCRNIAAILVVRLRKVPYCRATISRVDMDNAECTDAGSSADTFRITLTPKLRFNESRELAINSAEGAEGIQIPGVHRPFTLLVAARIRVSPGTEDTCSCKTHTGVHKEDEMHDPKTEVFIKVAGRKWETLDRFLKKVEKLCASFNMKSAQTLCRTKTSNPRDAETMMNAEIERRANQKRFESIETVQGLEKLPPEVRTMIWSYAVTPSYFLERRETPIWTYRPTRLMQGNNLTEDEESVHPRPDVQLLSALNKQYYAEAAHALYAGNGFAFWKMPHAQRFFQQVQPENLLLTRRYTLAFDALDYLCFIDPVFGAPQNFFGGCKCCLDKHYTYNVCDFLSDLASKTACHEQSPSRQPVHLRVLLPRSDQMRVLPKVHFSCHLLLCCRIVKAFVDALAPYRGQIIPEFRWSGKRGQKCKQFGNMGMTLKRQLTFLWLLQERAEQGAVAWKHLDVYPDIVEGEQEGCDCSDYANDIFDENIEFLEEDEDFASTNAEEKESESAKMNRRSRDLDSELGEGHMDLMVLLFSDVDVLDGNEPDILYSMFLEPGET